MQYENNVTYFIFCITKQCVACILVFKFTKFALSFDAIYSYTQALFYIIPCSFPFLQVYTFQIWSHSDQRIISYSILNVRFQFELLSIYAYFYIYIYIYITKKYFIKLKIFTLILGVHFLKLKIKCNKFIMAK